MSGAATARVAVLGLGEAGSRYAAGAVAAGHAVLGYDPFVDDVPAGVERRASVAEAVADADAVLAITAAALSPQLAAEAMPAMRTDAIYVDCTTSSPTTMQELGALAPSHGVRFADVAILGPVPVQGAATDAIVSGSGAPAVIELLQGFGAHVEDGGERAGDATARKLLRSVLMKGLAGVVLEAMEAGRAAGFESWIHEQIVRQLAGDGAAVIERFETGTRKHARRREGEMAAVVEYLDSLGAPREISEGTRAALERIAASA